MAEIKEKKSEETLDVSMDDVVVENDSLDLDFDYEKLVYEKMSDEEKKAVFEKLKKQNLMVLSVLNSYEGVIKEMEKKAVSRVTEEQYQRLGADFENYKKRSTTQIQSSYSDGKLDIITEFIAFLDNFEIAMPMITDEGAKKGVDLIYKSMKEIFKKNGVEEIESLGEVFDPEYHNAVMTTEAESKEQDEKVVEVFQKGYKKGKKILRYAQVKVAKV